MGLTIEDVLPLDDCDVRKVECPEWGGDVYLTVMSGDQRDEYDQRIADLDDAGTLQGIRAFVVAASWCDENGKRANPSVENIARLGSKNGKAMQRLFKVACQLSGLGAFADAAIGDAEKNLNDVQNGNSG